MRHGEVNCEGSKEAVDLGSSKSTTSLQPVICDLICPTVICSSEKQITLHCFALRVASLKVRNAGLLALFTVNFQLCGNLLCPTSTLWAPWAPHNPQTLAVPLLLLKIVHLLPSSCHYPRHTPPLQRLRQ